MRQRSTGTCQRRTTTVNRRSLKAELQRDNGATKAGRNSAVNLCIDPAGNAKITINEGRVKTGRELLEFRLQPAPVEVTGRVGSRRYAADGQQYVAEQQPRRSTGAA